jgi:hypothetical protein
MSEKISQTTRLFDLLSDGNPHSTNEIQEKIYGREHLGYANIHGRITDIRKKYGVEIINFKDDKIKSLSYYQILPPETNLDDGPKLGNWFDKNKMDSLIPLEEMPEYSTYNGCQGKLI